MSEELQNESEIPQGAGILFPVFRQAAAIVATPLPNQELLRLPLDPFLPLISIGAFVTCANIVPVIRRITCVLWFQKRRVLEFLIRHSTTASGTSTGIMALASSQGDVMQYVYIPALAAGALSVTTHLALTMRTDLLTMEYSEPAQSSNNLEVAAGVFQQA